MVHQINTTESLVFNPSSYNTGGIFIKQNGNWIQGQPMMKINGSWTNISPTNTYVKQNNIWSTGVTIHLTETDLWYHNSE